MTSSNTLPASNLIICKMRVRRIWNHCALFGNSATAPRSHVQRKQHVCFHDYVTKTVEQKQQKQNSLSNRADNAVFFRVVVLIIPFFSCGYFVVTKVICFKIFNIYSKTKPDWYDHQCKQPDQLSCNFGKLLSISNINVTSSDSTFFISFYFFFAISFWAFFGRFISICGSQTTRALQLEATRPLHTATVETRSRRI